MDHPGGVRRARLSREAYTADGRVSFTQKTFSAMLFAVPRRTEEPELVRVTATMGITGMKIGSIVVHCHEFERMVTFWQNALNYVPREPAKDGWVVLRDRDGKGPNLSFQARETPPPRRGWFHLDLYTDRQDEEVKRLLELGARRYPWRYLEGSDFVVLEDPDGNLFCVVEVAEPEK